MKSFTKAYPLVMPASFWRLAGMYLVVMNYRLRKRRDRQLNLSKLFGGIIAKHLKDHADWIRREFYEVRAALIREGTLPRFFSSDQLDAIECAAAPDIPDVVRIGWRERHGQESRAEKKALRVTARGTARAVPVAARQSKRVRGRHR